MSRKWPWILVFFVLLNFIFINPTDAKIIFDSETDKYNVHNNMEILEDTTGNLTIQDVKSMNYSDKFKKNSGGIPSYGYKSSVYWLKFEIENISEIENLILEFPYAPHDSIVVYEMKESGYKVYEGGDLLPFNKRVRPHRHVTFNIEIPKNTAQTYYVKIQSEGSLQLPVVLWKSEAFTEKSINEYLLLGIYIGITLAMIGYNLFLYASLRFKSYVWYILLLIGTSMSQLSFNGILYQFLWPNLPWWNNRSILFFMAFACIAASLFVNKFLEVKNVSKKLSSILNYSVFLNIIFIIILMFNYQLALYIISSSYTIYVLLIITITFISWRKGTKYARNLFFGWFVFLICSLISVLADSGIFPVNAFTKYILTYGAIFEMIFFSMALGERVKVIQEEKEKAEKQALENKEIAIKNLEKADRLKDEFLANTTHELRTPLHGMIGIAESLRDGVAGEPNQILKQNLSLIIQSGFRLLNLINDILDYSKLKTHEIQLDLSPVRIQEAVNIVTKINEPLLKNKDVTIVNKVPSDIPLINADENRVVQILQNLINNAIKYTEKGTITVSAQVEGNGVAVQISDTGIGINEEEIEKVFNEFVQGSNGKNKGGTGLGLNITKNLVQLHGGEISISSEVGKGTTVTFTLPIYKNENIEPVSATTYVENKIIENKPEIISYQKNVDTVGNILIADDDRVNIQVLVNHLKLKLPNYNLVIANDGEEILTKLNEYDNFDLVILDLMMPKKSGYEVCSEIRKHYSLTELPVLILTARSNIEDMVTAFNVGANDYLIKPYLKEELIARVETLLTLKKVMREIIDKTEQLDSLNKELVKLNDELETRVNERTKELQQKNEHLLLMESSRRHLLGNISHDIGTPLTSIQGYVKAMLDEIIPPTEHYLEIIYDKTVYINRLLGDLHDLSTLEAKTAHLHMENHLIEDFVDFLKGFETDVITKNLQFEFKNFLENEIFTNKLNIDIDRIRQVLENIISNAIKYSKEKGLICIEVHEYNEFFAQRKVEEIMLEHPFNANEDNKYIIIAVRDNGVGIDSKYLPYIFNRYYRADSNQYYNYKNMGLGLAIAKEIVDYHNGFIWAESRINEGSTFYVALPYILESN